MSIDDITSDLESYEELGREDLYHPSPPKWEDTRCVEGRESGQWGRLEHTEESGT